MQTITLQIEDKVYDKFFWLINHFSKNEVTTLDQSKYVCDDEYLRSIDGMMESIQDARNTPSEQGVSIDKLEW